MKTILSIDGGGIKGVIPAKILCYIEHRTGRPISSMFDLIAGTSTGGLISLGLTLPTSDRLSAKYSAEDILKIYTDRGREIFPKDNVKRFTNPYGIFEELYDKASIEKVLFDYFSDAPLSSCIAKTMVTSYDIHSRSPIIFKSWMASIGAEPDFLIRNIARATSAAPTYFEPVRQKADTQNGAMALVDGGLYANNPTVCALVEYLKLFGVNQELMVLSLGTGDLVRRFEYNQAKNWGKLQWISPILDIMFQGASVTADYQMKHIMQAFGFADNYYRFQTPLDLGNDDMDDASDENIDALLDEANQVLDDKKKEIEEACTKLISK